MALKVPKSLCRFCRQHRKKFVFAGVFIGGIYGVIKFAEYKIKDYISQEQQKLCDKVKMEKSFNQVQQHGLSIATAMMNEILACVKEAANTDEITQMLKDNSGDKITLWHELKIMVFTRVVTGVSAVVLVSLVLRVQLNQIAGLMFHTPSDDNIMVDPRQQKFLSIAHNHLKKQGIRDLANAVKKVAHDQLESMPLQAMHNAKNLETSLKSICSSLFRKSFDAINLSQIVVANQPDLEEWTVVEPTQQEEVDIWIAKTIDILESPDFETVYSLCINKGLSVVGKELSYVLSKSFSGSSESTQNFEAEAPLAKLLPILNSQISFICSPEFVEEISGVSILNKFLLNVYESFVQVQ